VFTFWAVLAALVGVLLVTVWRNRRRGRPWWYTHDSHEAAAEAAEMVAAVILPNPSSEGA
jgi:hypothetical protein